MAHPIGPPSADAFERDVVALAHAVTEPDADWLDRAWVRLDSLTKPPRSLGRLEDLAARMAVVQRTERPQAAPAALVVFAGDHGVTAEGVSPYPQAVTAQMVANFASGGAAINQLAAFADARLVLVDVGVAADTSGLPGVVQAKVRPGSANLAIGAAMTREEAAEAVMVGARLARELAAEGVRVIGAGEMGIGNSTSAAAIVAGMTGAPPATVVGRGAGVGDAGLALKVHVVERGVAVNQPDPGDPLGVLASLGGLEIAAMAGLILGGAAKSMCVVVDGFICAAAALVAVGLCPDAGGYLFASHLSAEPGHRVALRALGVEPVLSLDMRLGEGSGAALAIGLMRAACAVMNGMATFAEAGVDGPERS